MSAPVVTQADREAAARLAQKLGEAIFLGGNDLAAIRNGIWDNDEASGDVLAYFVPALARHRTAAEAASAATVAELVEREAALIALLTKAVADIATALLMTEGERLIPKWTAEYVAAINEYDDRAKATEQEEASSPDPDCPECGGEGVDADPYGRFDYDCREACLACWEQTAT